MWPFSSSYPLCSIESIADQEFDYIVVGGGTSGCVVATRLSEDPNCKVLLLERGPAITSWLSRVPLLVQDYRTATSPAYSWISEPLAYAANATNTLFTGKAFGGTSKINANLYHRSTPGEYNGWSEAGHKGWSWDDVKPYFAKSETSLSFPSDPARGTSGKWKNRCPDIYFGYNHKVIDACQTLNIPASPTLNVPESPAVCCGRVEVALTEKGLRQSTFDAFLPSQVAAERRSNLFICGGVIVTSLDIKHTGSGLRVSGVRVEKEDALDDAASRTFRVHARGEIVLSSGAIASPQLLMLSGIGPAEHLKEHGIPIAKDMPGVGANLQDHTSISVQYAVQKQDTLHAAADGDILLVLKEFVRFLVKGDGLLLSPNPQLSIFALSRLIDEKGASTPGLVDACDAKNVPDIEIMPIPYDCRDPKYKSSLKKDEGALSFLCAALRPRSKGTLLLASRDPRARPACDLGTLSDPADFVPLRAAIRLSKAIAERMKSQGYAMRSLQVPSDIASDADLDAFIRSDVSTTFHYSSTCRMAPEAEGGVVDDELRVYGVEGLRIADASIFPWIPAAHLQAPVVMVAERCADFILKARSG